MRPRTHILYLLTALAALAALGLFCIWPDVPLQPPSEKLAAHADTPAAVAPALRQTSYAIPVSAEGTVLEAMRAHAAATDFSFSGSEFPGLGLFVEEIGGLANEDGYYWTLFIDNALSEQGASSARVTPRNHVEWRYQKGL